MERLTSTQMIPDAFQGGKLNLSHGSGSNPNVQRTRVYQLSIGAACGLSWPSDRVIIQVLDGSTDPTIKYMVELESEMGKQRDKHKISSLSLTFYGAPFPF
ncbi:hypothetical protein OIU84_027795 [Salix udensis]|uniref:Uncharacterized protein n=1 Tax=Salix udensis TaxID=889485 RepID=A0AAD6KG37_9ROSI|nr:hypothetical protein OIU84_027795 [Salix udensis]